MRGEKAGEEERDDMEKDLQQGQRREPADLAIGVGVWNAAPKDDVHQKLCCGGEQSPRR